MISKPWIFFALCFAPFVECSEPASAACSIANLEYANFTQTLNQDAANFMVNFVQFPDRMLANDSAQAQSALDDFCEKLKLYAQIVENVISRCAIPSEQCSGYGGSCFLMPWTPETIRASAELCKTFRAAEYIPYKQTLRTCLNSFNLRGSQANEADNRERLRVELVLHKEVNDAKENLPSCCESASCGRKCACRFIQTEVPYVTVRPNGHIREVCGQEQEQLVLMLQQRALDAFNCSEFGDYVRDWGWFKVSYIYQGNETAATTPAIHM